MDLEIADNVYIKNITQEKLDELTRSQTNTELADQLRCSEKTISRMKKEGRIKGTSWLAITVGAFKGEQNGN